MEYAPVAQNLIILVSVSTGVQLAALNYTLPGMEILLLRKPCHVNRFKLHVIIDSYLFEVNLHWHNFFLSYNRINNLTDPTEHPIS